MSLEVSKRSGFVLRFLSLSAFAFTLLFAALVVMENRELEKLVPPSAFRSLALMCGYIVAIFGFNYAMAVRGRNFMGWKVEAAMIVGFVIIFVSLFLPFAFPNETEVESSGLTGLFGAAEIESEPRWAFSWLLLCSLPMFAYVYYKLRTMELWKRSL